MDALTFEVLLVTEPDTPVIDDDQDAWHIRCYAQFWDYNMTSGGWPARWYADVNRMEEGQSNRTSSCCYRCRRYLWTR